MAWRYLSNISEISPKQWNALIPDDAPFVRHEFLSALENSGCVSPDKGWLPAHLVQTNNNQLTAAMPFYIKGHSYGEYVFDWAWANAYHSHGYEYYPKGLCAIPFTPASSAKILIKASLDYQITSSKLTTQILQKSEELNLSSIHCLFLINSERKLWQEKNFLDRVNPQFHWHNNSYSDFNDYLGLFTSAKRKKIRQERKSINQSSIKFKIVEGSELTEQNWRNFFNFYINSIHNHGAIAYLNLDFFLSIGATMPENIMMILAFREQKNIASAFFIKSKTTLYGRYWGCETKINGLHFETCYYQAINYCIAHNISCFEAGAQGEHKLARGLLPVETHSAHWLRHPQFLKAVANHLKRETQHIEHYLKALNEHSPFKRS